MSGHHSGHQWILCVLYHHLTCKRKGNRFLSQGFCKPYITFAASGVSLRHCGIHCGMESQRNLIVWFLRSICPPDPRSKDISHSSGLPVSLRSAFLGSNMLVGKIPHQAAALLIGNGHILTPESSTGVIFRSAVPTDQTCVGQLQDGQARGLFFFPNFF